MRTNDIVVIKYGGSLLDDRAHRMAFLKDIASLPKSPRVILVHGGGKEISRQMEKAGLTPRFVNGRRFTDEATLVVVEAALKELNGEMVQALHKLGVRTKGYSGRDRHLMEATPVAELGRVGVPSDVKSTVLQTMLDDATIPIFYSIAEDTHGLPLNVNADEMALALATSLHAARLIYLTDTGGLLGRDGAVLTKVDEFLIKELINDGTIKDGMRVKVEACLEALRRGVGCVDLAKDVKFLKTKLGLSTGTTIALRKAAKV